MPFENGKELQESNENFERSFAWKSELATLGIAQEIAEENLTKLGWKAESAEDFGLAIREAVANAVIHGNLNITKGEDPDTFFERIKAAQALEENKEKLVQAVFNFTKDEAMAEISDEGNFVSVEAPDITSSAALSKGSGRGLALIWSLVSDVDTSIPGKITIRTRRADKEDVIE